MNLGCHEPVRQGTRRHTQNACSVRYVSARALGQLCHMPCQPTIACGLHVVGLAAAHLRARKLAGRVWLAVGQSFGAHTLTMCRLPVEVRGAGRWQGGERPLDPPCERRPHPRPLSGCAESARPSWSLPPGAYPVPLCGGPCAAVRGAWCPTSMSCAGLKGTLRRLELWSPKPCVPLCIAHHLLGAAHAVDDWSSKLHVQHAEGALTGGCAVTAQDDAPELFNKELSRWLSALPK